MTERWIPGRVTVGIPTRNRSAYLVRAVRSALAQSYAELEVVVSDNASTDDTVGRIEEIADSRVRLLKQPSNIGMVANFNACLQAASGELFLMLSDDDVLEPEAVDELSRPFYHHSQGIAPDRIGLTWCPCWILDSAGQPLWATEGGPTVETPLSLITSTFNGKRGPRFSGVMVRTVDALSVGGYDVERYGALCDMGNWARAALRYDYVACIVRPLAKYTMHAVSETSQSACREWQAWGENLLDGLIEALRPDDKTSGEGVLRAANRNLIANLTVTVLIQTVGQPGWAALMCREVFRARRYFFTPFLARRLLRDGWKILRVRSSVVGHAGR
jgi:glycosyltransferase involved in cell wall biosynthesis